MRKTKIIATIGPASRDPETLEKLITTGMDCARLNFSHGTLEEHGEVIQMVRQLSEKHRRPIAILQDLGGIKLRLGQLEEAVHLNYGDEVTIVPEEKSNRPDVLPFPEPDVLRNIHPGNLIYISDGVVCLEVEETTSDLELKTRVRNGGMLSSHKGVNLPGVTIDQPVLTEEDKVALQFGVEQDVDWVGISFVRTLEDMRYARDYLNSIGSKARVMAKLERDEGIENIDSILREVDGVMVARGDLGVEIPMERVPIVQKEIVRKASEAAKVSCIATQMLRSMVVSPTPTRAEVSDISNAVLDGCDSILLSDEIAVGDYPVEAVRVADVTIKEAEKIYPYYKDFSSWDRTQAIAASASRLSRTLNSKPIVVTSTGRAAFEVSRFRPENDIIVFSHDKTVLNKLTLAWGVNPVGVIPPERDIIRLVSMLIRESLSTGLVNDTDVVTIVHGYLTGVSGTTNTIQVLDLQEFLTHAAQLSGATTER
jgi:pyruvate kinase